MPSIITHHIFSDNVLKKLKNKDDIDIDIYHTFAQSHDYLYYYTFASKKNRKKIAKLAKYGHHKNTKDYLINIIKNIKENNLEYNKEALGYLYGSITHYVLDSTAHPYIFYKTGIYRKSERKSIIYNGGHTDMEKAIDKIYYELNYNKKYKNCNINKEIIGKPQFSIKLKELIDKTYKDTYKYSNVSYFFNKGIKHAKIISRLFFYDPLGLKYILYKIVGIITRKRIMIDSYSSYKKPNINYLNNEHNIWYHPSIKSISYNYSFDDLFDISLKKCIKIINAVNKVLFNNKDIMYLDKYILNIDYSTGLDLNNNKRMIYFE
ncbi:MAG: zinc dependent phospholipase C family protein [Bacilli bacterium]|nr:zinc dependent phospholipase C family protein [Bacilli bacterium]